MAEAETKNLVPIPRLNLDNCDDDLPSSPKSNPPPLFKRECLQKSPDGN